MVEEDLDAILARAEVRLCVPACQLNESRCRLHLQHAPPAQLTTTCPLPRPALTATQVVPDREDGPQPGRMGDLLGQFNVATFKTSELF